TNAPTPINSRSQRKQPPCPRNGGRPRHPARVETDDHVIQPAQAALALRDQARGERASAIPRDLQLDRPELGLHRLRRAPVAGVGVLRRLAGALLVAQVAAQLGLQTPLERCLDQRGHEPAVTGQLDLASVDLLEQGIQLPGGLQLLDQVLARAPIVMLLLLVRHGHDCSVPLGTAYTDHLTRPARASADTPPSPPSKARDARIVDIDPETGTASLCVTGPIPEIQALAHRLDIAARTVQRAQRAG